MKQLTDEFTRQAIFRMEENTPRIKKCLSEVSDEDVWRRPNGASNSIGNLVLHLCGNITQYVLSSMGGKPDERKRDEEFSATGGFTCDELLIRITTTVSKAIGIIGQADEKELLRERVVQGFPMTGTGIIIHVVEHYSYHTGQIAFWTELLKDKDLGFYAGVDLNRKNSRTK
jgi:uncharacterized damage-inducible protein DinB